MGSAEDIAMTHRLLLLIDEDGAATTPPNTLAAAVHRAITHATEVDIEGAEALGADTGAIAVIPIDATHEEALEDIVEDVAALLDGVEWTPDTLDRIAARLRTAGFIINDCEADR